jgi:hypothetical protein
VEEEDSDDDVAIDELLDENENEDINDGDELLKDETIKDLSSTLKIADEDDLVDDEDK